MKKWKKATACVLCAVLFLQGMPQQTASAEENGEGTGDTQAVATFSIAYEGGSFVKTEDEILDAKFGTVEYELEAAEASAAESEIPDTGEGEPEVPDTGEGEPEVPDTGEGEPEVPDTGEGETDAPDTGEGETGPESQLIRKITIIGKDNYFARQSNSQEGAVESEIFLLKEQEGIEKVTFSCPEEGNGTLEIEMLEDTDKPDVKVNEQGITEDTVAVLPVRSNTQFTVEIEAIDNGSGIKQVEWSRGNGEYDSLTDLVPIEKREADVWSDTVSIDYSEIRYFWISDYYGNRTKAEVHIEVDDKAPEINQNTIKASGVEEITDKGKHYWGEAEKPALELEVDEPNKPITATYSIYKKSNWWIEKEIGKVTDVQLNSKGDRQILPLDADMLNKLENGSYRIKATFTDSLGNSTDTWNPVSLYEFTVNKTEFEIVLLGDAADAELNGVCTVFSDMHEIKKDFVLQGGNPARISLQHPGSVEISFADLNGLQVSGIQLNGKSVSSAFENGVLKLDGVESRNGRLEITAAYAMKFTAQYQDGSFLEFSNPPLNAKIGKAEIKGNVLNVCGEEAYFAKQCESNTEAKVESETFAEEKSNKVDLVAFTCPETGNGTLTVEMVTDEGDPEVKLSGEQVVEDKVFVDTDGNFSVTINAVDQESGVKKVEYTDSDKNYDEITMEEVERAGDVWIHSGNTNKSSNLYFWVSDYYNNQTSAEIKVIVDYTAPVIHKDSLTVTGTEPVIGSNGNYYWKESSEYGLRFQAEEENGPIVASYNIIDTVTGKPVQNGKDTEFIQELKESTEEEMYDFPLDASIINGLPDGSYRISVTFSDAAKNKTEKDENFYTFTLNRKVPEVTPETGTNPFWLKPSDDADAVKDIKATLKTGQSISRISYAITASTKDGEAEEPAENAWNEIPEAVITISPEGAEAAITYELPVGNKKDGTVTYYLWVKDALDHTTKKAITCHFDGTVPEFSDFHAELQKSGNPIARAFQYVFGSILNGKETLVLTVDARDPYNPSGYTQFPALESVELYYMEKDCTTQDDQERGSSQNNESDYQSLTKAKASVQKISAKDAANQQADGTGTYQFQIQVKKKNKFYKLYFVATDKAGNRKILNAASLAADGTSAFVMADDKAPGITSSLQASCEKADYEAGNGKQKKNWYRGDRTIRYNLSVTDKESGLFSVGASINGTALEKDAKGKDLYDSSTAKNPERLKVEPGFAYVINPKQGTIAADGGYKMEFRAEDNAGNVTKASNQIYVDKDAPVIQELSFDTGETDGLVTVPTQYGYFFRKQTKVIVSATDYIGNSQKTGSGVSTICYRLLPADGATPITGELSVKEIKDGICRASFTIPEGFKGQIEVSAVDQVGQSSKYYNPKGAVVETPKEHNAASKAEILLPKTDYKDSEGNPLYDSAITTEFDTADSHSGLQQNTWVIKEYNAPENMAGGTLSITSAYDETQDTWSSTLSGDTDWKLPGNLDLNLVTWAKREQHVDTNTNHISAALSIMDNAGNTSAARPKVFSIDQSAPVIEVSYDNNDVQNEDCYKEIRTATITVTDANFSEKDCDFILTGPETQISPWKHQAGDGCDGTVHTSSCKYSCQIAFTQDGDYTFGFSCKDLAGHVASYGKTDKFTIDTVKPVIRVSYDNNTATGGSYYQAARKATIEIEDKNFNPADARVEVTGQKAGAAIETPEVSSFTQNGDIWSASVSYPQDGDYTFSVAATDKAGNPAEEYAQESFTVDQTPPELSIEGVAENSANNGTVAPVIKTSDINLDGASLTVTLTGANHGQVSYESRKQQTDQDVEIAMEDFSHTEEMDDLYTLEAVVSDRAGNETRETLVFSVNRFGSVYLLEDSTSQLVEQFYSNQEQDVVITEVNVDTLQFGEISYSLDGNIVTLEKGKDYEVTTRTDESSWKMYEYRIKADNFRQEGSYVVSLYSEDLAQNRSSNKAKGKEVSFVIDKTAPSIVVAGVEDNGQYMDASRNITVDTQDNILLDSVGVYTNDEKKTTAGREELLESNGQVSLSLTGSNQQQKLYVEARDAAGNVARSHDISFLITKNMLVQWYSNLPLCVGSIGATATAGAAGVTVFRRRRIRIKH